MTGPIRIDAGRAVELLREVVAESGPDYKYTISEMPSGARLCRYVVDGQPSCLVARALHRAGFTLSDLERMDTHVIGISTLLMDPVRNGVVADLRSRFTADAIRIFAAAQRKQDSMRTWGVALAAAEEAYNTVNARPS
jgi:hypothetical protein